MNHCSKASCSATRRARSRAPRSSTRGNLSNARAAPYSLTRSGTCRTVSNRNSSASCKSRHSSGFAGMRQSRPTCASSRPPTMIWMQLDSEEESSAPDLYSTGLTGATIRLPPLREPAGRPVRVSRVLPEPRSRYRQPPATWHYRGGHEHAPHVPLAGQRAGVAERTLPSALACATERRCYRRTSNSPPISRRPVPGSAPACPPEPQTAEAAAIKPASTQRAIEWAWETKLPDAWPELHDRLERELFAVSTSPGKPWRQSNRSGEAG